MANSEKKHVCKALVHQCEYSIYDENSRRIYHCCNYCNDKCRNRCMNDHRICGQHILQASGKPRYAKTDSRNKPVLQFDGETGVFLMRYESCSEAARVLNVNNSTIIKACRYEKLFRGDRFVYEEEYNAQKEAGTAAV